jgi:phage protein D
MTTECTYKVTIGAYNYRGIAGVSIKRSTRTLGDTATLLLPQTYMLKKTGPDTDTTIMRTQELVKRGDLVEIHLGYGGKNRLEFKGFVKQVNFKHPLEIECEDHLQLLKNLPFGRSYKATNLKNVLTDIIAGAPITLNPECIALAIDKLRLDNGSGQQITAAQALEKLKDTYMLAVYFNTQGQLFAGLYYTQKTGTAAYTIGHNTVNADDLKYTNAADVKLQLKATHVSSAGVRTEATVGDPDGATRSVFFTGVKTKAELEQLATNELKKYKYDGYQGKLTTFAQPYIQPGYTAVITDPEYSQRSGSYYVEAVNTEFTTSAGIKRTIEIGPKVN